MSDLAKVAEAARGFTRQFSALAEFARALEEAGSVEASIADLNAARDAAKKDHDAAVAELDDVRNLVAKAKADLAAIKKDLVERIKATDTKCEEMINTAESQALAASEAVKADMTAMVEGLQLEIKVAEEARDKVQAEVADAEAQLAKLNQTLAEVREKVANL